MAFGLLLIIGTAVLSSLRTTDADLPVDTSGSDGIIIVKLSTFPIVVLGGDVNLTFRFPSNSSGVVKESLVYGRVYDGLSNNLLHTGTSQLYNDSRAITVNFPCAIFDHPGTYNFKYRISEHGLFRSINQSLTLDWSKVQLKVPTNHAALTRLGYWIDHKRRCLSENYRDRINLYHISADSGAKVVVFNKTVRKLKLSEENVGRTRMTLRCNVLDARGTYIIEYRSGFSNITLASSTFNVYWGAYPLQSPQRTINPCTNNLPISFPIAECIKVGDTVKMFERGSDRLVNEKHVLPGMTSVFFPCTLFKGDYVREYCFHYVTRSQKTETSETLSKLCLPTYKKGEHMNEGWGHWSPWGMCTSSCGEGKQYRYRYCRSTSSQTADCQGNSVRSRSCPLNPCPDHPHKCACGCQLTAPEGMITSSPALFKRIGQHHCTWRINLRGNTRIKLWFDALKMDGDTILVRDGNDSSAPLLATVKDGFSSSIVSKGNSMYIFYSHNGKWKNGTKRGFTASYRAKEEQLVWKKKSLGTAEATFLAVFIFSILLLGIVLFAVFIKLRRQQRETSSGSSNTSESTSRSTIPSSPLDDEASSNEPLRNEKSLGHERLERTNKKRERDKRRRRRHRRRHEYMCDVTIPRCSCAEMSGIESGSGSYSTNDCYNSPRRTSVERAYVAPYAPQGHGCDCPQCFYHAHQCMNCDQFGVPSRKYYGDWMVTEGLHENYQPLRPGDQLIYHRDTCTDCRNSNEDFV